MKPLPALLLLVSAVAVIGGAGVHLRRIPRFAPLDPEMAVPQADYLQLFTLGNRALASDLVLARALTYFGAHYRQRAAFPYVNLPRLFDLACRLDPRNAEAFLMGANLTGAGDPRGSLDLLRLGNLFHPQAWKFPELIGFRLFFFGKDSYSAARYYEAAARLPGHPPYVSSLAGKLYDETGRTREAIRVLTGFWLTARDRRLKESFGREIRALQAKLAGRNR